MINKDDKSRVKKEKENRKSSKTDKSRKSKESKDKRKSNQDQESKEKDKRKSKNKDQELKEKDKRKSKNKDQESKDKRNSKESKNPNDSKESKKTEEKTKPKKFSTREDIEFQILDWGSYNEKGDKPDEEDSERKYKKRDSEEENDNDDERDKYTIRIFGRTAKDDKLYPDQSVYAKVKGFCPYFYVEIPKNWEQVHVDCFISEIKKKVYWKHKDGLKSYKVIEKHKFRDFTCGEKFKFIKLVFHDYDVKESSFRSYERLFTRKLAINSISKYLQPKNRMYGLYESNIEPIFRCMHIRNLNACGWIKLNKNTFDKTIDPETGIKPTICDINIETDWKNLQRVDKQDMAKFKIMGLDIECVPKDGMSFPRAEKKGDKVIQIGMTYSRTGEDECYFKHIITLKKCNKFPEADLVEYFDTEKEVLYAFKKAMDKYDPDIIIGWNIFGFDMKYMFERATGEYATCPGFVEFSRIINKKCKLEDKKLSSSAMGDNLLYYFEMTGRILIDLMKVVQRGFQLSSYKLDYALSYFISEKITKAKILNKSIKQLLNLTPAHPPPNKILKLYEKTGIKKIKKINKLLTKKESPNAKLFQAVFDILNLPPPVAKPPENKPKEKDNKSKEPDNKSNDKKDKSKNSKDDKKDKSKDSNDDKKEVKPQPVDLDKFRHPISKDILDKIGAFDKLANESDKKIIDKIYFDEFPKKPEITESYLEDIYTTYNKFHASSGLYALNKRITEKIKDSKFEKYVFDKVDHDPAKCEMPPFKFTDEMKTIFKKYSEKASEKELEIVKEFYMEIFRPKPPEKKPEPSKKEKEKESEKEKKKKKIVKEIKEKIKKSKSDSDKEKSESESNTEENPDSDEDTKKKKIKTKYNVILRTEKTKGLKVGNYICLNYNDGISDDSYAEGRKLKVIKLTKDHIYLYEKKKYLPQLQEILSHGYKLKWNISKDDMKPKEMFKKQKGDKDDRAEIAKYCIQDCVSCNRLFEKLQVMNNNVGMANVCSVPLSYLFLRGQGIKGYSLVSQECRKLNYLIPTLKRKEKEINTIKLMNYCIGEFGLKLRKRKLKLDKQHLAKLRKECSQAIDILADESEYILFIEDFYKGRDLKIKLKFKDLEKIFQEGYEGASVVSPKPGIYYIPIVVLDYSSLYPKAAIHRNISHETIVKDPKYDNLPGYYYYYVKYRNNDGSIQICKYARPMVFKEVNEDDRDYDFNKEDDKGIIPKILLRLLEARETTKKLAKIEKDPFKQKILDGLQLAYKITANSLYGLLGASTSPIYYKELAASITATGRDMLKFAQDLVLENFKGSEIIYGDTDSTFIKFPTLDKNGKQLEGNDAIKEAFRLGKLAEKLINDNLPYPHAIVLEKILYPFGIITKKRYFGYLFENPNDLNQYYLKCMGIVLKRRDNAQIVKIICGRIIHYLIKEKSIPKAVEYTKKALIEILNGKYGIDKFVITKTLKEKYKNADGIAHKQLADRMGMRDEGSRPQVNDRIPYVYIQVDAKKINAERRKKIKEDRSKLSKEERQELYRKDDEKNKKKTKKALLESILQGDRIEHIDYVKEQKGKVKIDYLFYITNQIMVPACQFFELVIENPEKIFKDVILKETNRRKGRKLNNVSNFLKTEQGENVEKVDFVLKNPNKKKVKALKKIPKVVKTGISSFLGA